MEAIIIAGGFGSRLRHVVPDVPKPMAPIGGTPFLQYIITDLSMKGIKHVVMAVGYKKQIIIDYFGHCNSGITIDYSIEDKPLLTGGAIKKAIKMCKEETVFAINGDTYFDVDLNDMIKKHKKDEAALSLAIKYTENVKRYGCVLVGNDRVTGFKEKGTYESGFINGGIYCMHRSLLDGVAEVAFSFEKDYLEKEYNNEIIKPYISDGYFIDIGVPEDYYRAQAELPKMRNR